MSNELKISMLKARRDLLEARGSHNARIVAKINRQIRLKEKENAN